MLPDSIWLQIFEANVVCCNVRFLDFIDAVPTPAYIALSQAKTLFEMEIRIISPKFAVQTKSAQAFGTQVRSDYYSTLSRSFSRT